jgi:murein DD-endopeptidase MepM/ murein hydrolase activator NlpD
VPVALIWPVPGGKLTSGFGVRGARKHEGIDIAAAEGTAVLAAAGGRVIYSGAGVKGYGNLILVRHTGGIVTVYAHNRRNMVKEGDRVQQGQVIAEVGHTGRASGDHLHFEVRRGDTPVDPSRLVSVPPSTK